ncbi:hypothetical protein VNO80_09767 [Phaseolus coccineus]|uniref:Uncharacterized protein n=1 Tax=Phaseolus coccineus TaxID=3886 RepID=A0AAN9NC76_PHACN
MVSKSTYNIGFLRRRDCGVSFYAEMQCLVSTLEIYAEMDQITNLPCFVLTFPSLDRVASASNHLSSSAAHIFHPINSSKS